MSPVERSRNPDINHIRQELRSVAQIVLRIGKEGSVETRTALSSALRHAADEISGTAEAQRTSGAYAHVEHHDLRKELVELEKELIKLAAELGLEFGKLPKILRNATVYSVTEIASHLDVSALELKLFRRGKRD